MVASGFVRDAHAAIVSFDDDVDELLTVLTAPRPWAAKWVDTQSEQPEP